MVVVHGLAQVTEHPILQGAVPTHLIGVRGNEYRRDTMSYINQVPVELDPRHSRHLNVADQARRGKEEGRRQEIGGRGERFDSVAQRHHELSHGFAKGLIIFDDRDQCRFRHRFNLLGPMIGACPMLVPAYNPNVSEASRQSNARGRKRWLMPSAIRLGKFCYSLGKEGCSRRRIVSRMRPF